MVRPMDQTTLLDYAPAGGRVLLRRVALAALTGGLVAGALDIAFAVALHGLRGIPPTRVLQSVASGLLGSAAYAGGGWSALLGAAVHFAMAIAMAGSYSVLSLRFPVLRDQPTLCGAAWGVALFVVMNHAIVPLSAAVPGGPPPAPAYALGLAAHVLLVGIPVALIARRLLPN